MTSFFKRPETIATALVLAAIGAVAARTHREREGEHGKELAATTGSVVAPRRSELPPASSSAPGFEPVTPTALGRINAGSVPACCKPPVRSAAIAAQQASSKASQRPDVRSSRDSVSSVDSTPRFQPADPFAPGNSLPVAGGSLIVQASRQNPKSATPELDLKFSPIALTPSNKETASDAAIKTPEPQSTAAAVNRPGLTYEQELFRTKWGWAAFDQAQRESSEFGAEQ